MPKGSCHNSCILRTRDVLLFWSAPIPFRKNAGHGANLGTKRTAMDPNLDTPAKMHFHIRWTRAAKLDWEAFNTRTEAVMRALELARPGEKFMIEESEETCSRCGEISHRAANDQDSVSN